MKYVPHAFLDTISVELDALDAQAKNLLYSLSLQTFNQQPQPGRWSVGQCFDHLVKINQLYFHAVELALQTAKDQNLTRSTVFSHNLFERLSIWNLEPPSRIRLPAPSRVQARTIQLDPAEIGLMYFEGHATLRQLMRDAREVDIKQARVLSPISSRFKLSVAATFALMMAHERRHLLQAERASYAADFAALTNL